MKKIIFFFSIFWFGLNLANDNLSNDKTNEVVSSNPFYSEDETNLYMYDYLSGKSYNIPPPPPPPGNGAGGSTPGGPTVIISMYLPFLFMIAIYIIYKAKSKTN